MRSQQESLEAAGELLRRHHVFLISSHLRLDCDGLAAELALAHVLGVLGKQAHIVNPGSMARALRFLPGSERVTVAGDVSELPPGLESLAILDCPDLSRLGGVAALLPAGLPLLNIDHHPDNALFGTVNLADPEASSTCELLCRVIRANGFPLPPEAATNLYAGILSDTGRFCFSNTTAEALSVAARLIRLGADPVTVGHHLYEDFLPGQLRLWAEVVGTIDLALAGRVAVAVITQEVLARHSVSSEDTQDFAEIPRLVSGVEVGVLLSELPEGRVKVSLRSHGPVDVNAMAARLGGGGHQNAAGAVVSGALSEVRRGVLAVVEEGLAGSVGPVGEKEARG